MRLLAPTFTLTVAVSLVSAAADETKRDYAFDGPIPDVTKLETRLWYFYRAAGYIDAGYEAIEFGQIGLTGAVDTDYRQLGDLLKRVRSYAATKARRHYVLLNTQLVATARPPIYEGRLMFDYLNFPLHPQEVPGQPEKAVLEMGHAVRSPVSVDAGGWPLGCAD